MNPNVTLPGLRKTFALDNGILAPGSAASVELSASTDADVAIALATDSMFPTRPNGEIDLAHIGLSVSGSNPVAFHAGNLAVGFQFGAGVTVSAGVFDKAEAALAALGFAETPGVDLSVAAPPNTRYLLLNTNYRASGSVKGTHPIGALGAFTFGVSAAATGKSAVLHRFDVAQGAATVMGTAISNWRLPRHVDSAARLAPQTWVIAEADGSLAVKLAASLGYNFDFVREAKVAGLSGDIGLKIDAAATATFGLEVSGRYVVVVGRESSAASDQVVRVRLFKLSSKGLQLGLNLKIGVTGVETMTPGRVDDFVKAVFGVHGAQIVRALENIEKWTDKNASVGQLLAGLSTDKALDLLKQLTGVDPEQAFDAARRKLLDAIRSYQSLPDTVSSELLSVVSRLGQPEAAVLNDTLALLASDDEAIQKHVLLDLLEVKGLADTPAARLIEALADRGVLALFDRLSDVRRVARTIQSILDGGVIERLQRYVDTELGLDRIIAVAKETDFDRLDSFLVGRLGAFFDKELHFSDLNEVKDAINLVVGKREEVYAKARKALNSRYGTDLTSAWQRTRSDKAVLDIEFDTAQAEGLQLLAAALKDSDFEQILLSRSTAVRRRAAVLTHDMTRKTTIDVAMPHFSFHRESFNDAIARVSAEDEGARVLLYDATGEDVVAVRNKFRSSLAIGLSAAVSNADRARFPDLRIHSTGAATWSYRLLHAKARIGREELEAYTRPFIVEYMGHQFMGETNLSAWYAQLDRTVENVLNNGPEEFGDVCAAFEVTMPGELIGAWMQRQSNVRSAAKAMSKAIQKSLKQLVAFYYLSDVAKAAALVPTSALLTWSALRPTNAIRIDGATMTFDAGDGVFWDERNHDERRMMTENQITAQNLVAMLEPLRLRLEEAGRHHDVQFYTRDQVPTIMRTALSTGEPFFLNLLSFESSIVQKAAAALDELQTFVAVAGSSPSQAIDRLAEFAADITTAFNKLTGQTVFAGLSFRAVSQAVFAEASRALDPAIAGEPRALLALTVLKPRPTRRFDLSQFLDGAIPPQDDIALAQHLVSG